MTGQARDEEEECTNLQLYSVLNLVDGCPDGGRAEACVPAHHVLDGEVGGRCLLAVDGLGVELNVQLAVRVNKFHLDLVPGVGVAGLVGDSGAHGDALSLVVDRCLHFDRLRVAQTLQGHHGVLLTYGQRFIYITEKNSI